MPDASDSPIDIQPAALQPSTVVDLLQETLHLWKHEASVQSITGECSKIRISDRDTQIVIARTIDPRLDRPCWALRVSRPGAWTNDKNAVRTDLVPALPALLRRLRELLGLPPASSRAIIGLRPSVLEGRSLPPARTPRDSPAQRSAPQAPRQDGPIPASAPMPVYVLTGFLGSGKTTLLNRLLRTRGLTDTAVIVNEFGDVGIDHLLVEASDEQLVELAGGCVCCTVRGDLARTIAELLARRDRGECSAFTRIVVETTGLADPIPIINLLATDPVLAEHAVAAGIATTIDAPNALSNLTRFTEATRQVALANWLILTKTDVTEPAPELFELLSSLNPGATLQQTRLDTVPDIGALFTAQPLHAHTGVTDPQHQHDAHLHAHDFQSVVISRSAPVPAVALTLLIQCLAEQLGPKLLRVKGLIRLAGTDRPAVLQGAQHVFHPVDFLLRWPSGHTPATQLVFIVQGANAPLVRWLQRLLDALCEETVQMGEHVHRQSR